MVVAEGGHVFALFFLMICKGIISFYKNPYFSFKIHWYEHC